MARSDATNPCVASAPPNSARPGSGERVSKALSPTRLMPYGGTDAVVRDAGRPPRAILRGPGCPPREGRRHRRETGRAVLVRVAISPRGRSRRRARPHVDAPKPPRFRRNRPGVRAGPGAGAWTGEGGHAIGRAGPPGPNGGPRARSPPPQARPPRDDPRVGRVRARRTRRTPVGVDASEGGIGYPRGMDRAVGGSRPPPPVPPGGARRCQRRWAPSHAIDLIPPGGPRGGSLVEIALFVVPTATGGVVVVVTA